MRYLSACSEPHPRAHAAKINGNDRNEFYRASLRALAPFCRPPTPPLLQPPLPPPLPLTPARDWIEVPNPPISDEDDDDWSLPGSSPVAVRAAATTDATTSINKRDVARLARVSCGGSIWSLSTPPARFSYWRLWSPIESPKSVVCTI
tara:strand:- start:2050 stop:2493 length:444 start_codon:yes stop_codon:yes gene_type:complete